SEDRRGGPETALILRDGLPAGTREGDHVVSLLPLTRRTPFRSLARAFPVVTLGRFPRLGPPAEGLEDLGHRVLDDLVDPRKRFHHPFELLVRGCLAPQEVEVALQELVRLLEGPDGLRGEIFDAHIELPDLLEERANLALFSLRGADREGPGR